MKGTHSTSLWVVCISAILVLSMVLTGCGATAAPTATQVPATKAVQPTAAPATAAAAPTAAPTAKPTAAAPSKQGGTFVMSLGNDPSSLNGIIGNDGNSLPVIGISSNVLINGGENRGAAITADLVTKWEASADAKVWTLYLRKDVKWQDGKPFTADDVIFTFKTIQDPKVTTGGFSDRFMEDGQPIPFEKVDDYTIKATLKNPSASFPTNITVPILPKHILDGQDVNTAAFNKMPIGTGPFKVVEWKSGESVTLQANPDYFLGRPYLDKWVYRIIPDSNAALAALQSGEIDFASIAGKDVAKFLNNPKFTITTVNRDNCAHIMINSASPFLSDKRVRQALIYALDRQSLLDTGVQGYGTVADSPFNQPVFMYQAGKLTQYKFDLEKSKALLKDAGWADANGDGILEKDGKPFKITITVISSNSVGMTIAPILQAQWKKVGIDLAIQAKDSATVTKQIFRNTELDKGYDLFWNGWGLFGADPEAYAAYYAPSKAALSPMNYKNDQVNVLFDKGRVTADMTQRKAIYTEAEKLLWDDLPMLPIWYPKTIYVAGAKVGLDEAGFDPGFLPPFLHPEKIYIKK